MEQTKNYRICDSWLASNHSRDNPSFLQEPMKIQPDFGPKTTHFVALYQKRRFNEIQSTNNTLENINKSILECEKKLKKLKEQKEHLLLLNHLQKKKKILNLKELYILKVNLKETTNISKVLLLFKILDP